MFGKHGRYIGNINHLWRSASFSPMGFVCVRAGPYNKWWQRWDGVRLELPDPRISQAKFWDETLGGESNVMFVKR